MHPLLVEARSASLSRRIRNAIIRTSRKHDLAVVRGPCGYFDTCGASWTGWYQTAGDIVSGVTANQVVKLNRSRGRVICPICAVLADKGLETHIGGDIEDMFASLMDLHTHEVVGFLQGWDGDTRAADAEDLVMFNMGRKLARDLVEDFDVSDVSS
jgi:hypothetical protein